MSEEAEDAELQQLLELHREFGDARRAAEDGSELAAACDAKLEEVDAAIRRISEKPCADVLPVRTVTPENTTGLLLYVRLPTGEMTCVDVSTDATVAELKDAVFAVGGPSPRRQVILNGAELIAHGPTPLADTQLSMEATITVLQKQRRSIVSVSNNHCVALQESGSVLGWGRRDCWFPVPMRSVFRGKQAVSVHAGVYHSAAILDDRTLVAWGKRGAAHQTPFEGRALVSYSCSGGAWDFSAGATEEGEVIIAGQEAPGLRIQPGEIESNAVAVACGTYHLAVLMRDGSVVVKGSSVRQQTDLSVLAGARVTSIAAGVCHTAAVLDDGTVRCFGWNDANQCDVPADVEDTSVVCGGLLFSAALSRSGRLRLWGNTSELPATELEQGRHLAVTGNIRILAGVYHTGSIWCVGRCFHNQENPPRQLAAEPFH
eukprot:TRINITY_DN40411_c0_g1_i1.p1 TRINITY_DN40411_c0_g1~~TRINITY_DN40411_c0_g1_i1.p1  ORF type:complete len:431 (+),score=172.59 TRINITY_DN40411_c0_g1_i1:64-1356(+)